MKKLVAPPKTIEVYLSTIADCGVGILIVDINQMSRTLSAMHSIGVNRWKLKNGAQ